MKIKPIYLSAILICLTGFKTQETFDQFTDKFVKGYRALKIPNLDLSYVNVLKQIKPADQIRKQIAFFESIRSEQKKYAIGSLSNGQQQDYELIAYETNMNLERLALEKQWETNKQKEISAEGLYTIPDGKAWYRYFLRNWLSANVTPDEIYQFGLEEVKRVQGHIEDIRRKSGLSEDVFYKHLNDEDFFINNPRDVLKYFEETQAVIYKNMGNVFSEHKIEPLKIEQGANEAMVQAPGYYDNSVFYYNQFNKPYNKRQVDWLFIHEAVPGHHYKSSINTGLKQSKVQQLFYYLGLEEGWGAYVEELGKDLGVYRTPYDELGKWEWDLVRSVRVPMDIGLNYYGWTDQQALTFWKKNIKNQDDIAMREIARVKRWPAQCITYKYGAGQILQWKQLLQKREGDKFNIKNFHDRILNLGSLPVFMVKKSVLTIE
ncbi:DUF885 domain-containing protein [Mucilaginibacter sp.]|uniref:DUF885 domain-containing protein n=1 Tax=Mucilaginibacter sp. TaxID=1882438 RepID=UPI00260726D4|nr:DUF885 domain-containing protein [Mucilaginibacter sp.]MDB4921588.1 hypothetical protein [Mucilaginibacter sp.]